MATISLTLGGFGGLLAGVRKPRDSWDRREIAGMKLILENAFAASLFSLLPFLILFWSDSQTLIWAFPSFLLSSYLILQCVFNSCRIYELEQEGEPPRMKKELKKYVLPFLLFTALWEMYNAIVIKSILPYAMGLVILLLTAGVQFFVFMRFIWGPEKEINLKLLIESVVSVFEFIIKQKGLTCTVNIYENLPPIYADEERIKKILTSLLSNAVKFTEKGGVSINAKLSEKGIKRAEPPIFAEVCVEDTGIGIKKEEIIKIFDKFAQVEASINRQYEGTGLGLNIVKRLVELHKGKIWVTSTYGKGSKFCFTLPLKKSLI